MYSKKIELADIFNDTMKGSTSDVFRNLKTATSKTHGVRPGVTMTPAAITFLSRQFPPATEAEELSKLGRVLDVSEVITGDSSDMVTESALLSATS